MEIKKCTIKTKCDISGCKQLADFCICSSEGKSILNLCSQCCTNLYKLLGSINKPKSIPAPFKKQKKIQLEAK